MSYSKYQEFYKQVGKRTAKELALAAGVTLAQIQLWERTLNHEKV